MPTFDYPFEEKLYRLAMQAADDSYDAAVRMSTSYRGKNGYHSRLSDCTVHEVNKSLGYARRLLLRNEQGDCQRACDILYRVVPLQDINPCRATYGIWQYYLEEDLEEMDPPDWNWADFNGKELLKILLFHGDLLTDDLKMRLKDAIHHACLSIIRRNVGPHYSNISVMGAYVTLTAGELFGWDDVFAYGKQRLKDLYAYNAESGNFREFNSPTYTFVILYDLTALQRDVKDAECVTLAAKLLEMAWKAVAVHYHAASGQLAGPHDRAYEMLLSDATKFAIEKATGYRVHLIPDYDSFTPETAPFVPDIDLKCPDPFIPFFDGTACEPVQDQTFSAGRMAYTYMADRFTVGSLHLEQAWHQHRNVLGYFGTVSAPIAFNLKCLHDDWDYCSALMATVQQEGKVLTGINFLTDAGDSHPALDMVKNATISVSDLRIRYLFTGCTDSLRVAQVGETAFEVTDTASDVRVSISFPLAVFGDYPVSYEVTRDGADIGIDVVLYHGERTELDFRTIEAAVIVAALEIGTSAVDTAGVTAALTNGTVNAAFDALTVSVPAKPASLAAQVAATKLYRSGERYQPAY